MIENGSAAASTDVVAGENLRPKKVGRFPVRTLPDDFAQVAPTKSLHALKRHYSTNEKTIRRWCEATGVGTGAQRRAPLSVPDDFRDIARVNCLNACARHYGVNGKTVRRWADLLGDIVFAKPPVRGHALGRPMPEDFAQVAPTLTRAQLLNRYAAGAETVARWLAQANVNPKLVRSAFQIRSITAPATDGTQAGEAAHYLRRHFSPVYRCDILSKQERSRLPNKGNGMWVVGAKGALNATALVNLAKAKGFDPNAWARI